MTRVIERELTLSSAAQKVAFVLCKNEAQRNAQNKGRFLGQLQRLVRLKSSNLIQRQTNIFCYSYSDLLRSTSMISHEAPVLTG